MTIYLVLQLVPVVTGVIKIKRAERQVDFSEELVSTEPVPVPHTQPKSLGIHFKLRWFVLLKLCVCSIIM